MKLDDSNLKIFIEDAHLAETIEDNPVINGNVVLCGDLHHDFIDYEAVIDHNPDSHIIVLGDCGFGFYAKDAEFRFFELLNRRAVRRNSFLYFLRGNHDNIDYWIAPLKNEVNDNFSNLTFLSHGPISLNGDYYYLLPGGVSVDRVRRIMGISKFPGEEIFIPKNFKTLCKKITSFKGILSHTGITPDDLGTAIVDSYSKVDGTLLKDLKKERTTYERLINKITKHNKKASTNIHCIYGHYHHSWSGEIPELINGHKVSLRTLNIAETLNLNDL